MYKKIACVCFLALPGLAAADDIWRDVISSGATTASTYLTFKDNKVVGAARDDASSFVASNGELRGPYLEAALQELRASNPGADDMQLATAILAAQ
jgi:uncharacterized protein (TIGR02448 family)